MENPVWEVTEWNHSTYYSLRHFKTFLVKLLACLLVSDSARADS